MMLLLAGGVLGVGLYLGDETTIVCGGVMAIIALSYSKKETW